LSVLILSSPQDLHSQAVERQLVKLGKSVSYWRPQNLLNDSTFNLTLGGNEELLCRVRMVGEESVLELNQFESVWLRRPGQVKSRPMPASWIERLCEHESTRALQGTFRLWPCFWVNHPQKQSEAMLKIYQLEMAKQCGLLVPKTLITNDPEQARLFSKSEKGKIIYKLIDSRSGLCFPSSELPRSIPTMPFRQTDADYLNQVASCLHLFQARVKKVSDLRVTIVGQSIFAAEIKSQSEGELLDWRSHAELPMAEFQLPETVKKSCLRLMQRLGLTFAALDFCLDSDGRCVFLEINPDGQFLWIEEEVGLPISKALARLLAQAE
jgi:glutathione synthase/RimK-type ligase-like ATP-grasp enzyme